MSRGIVLAVLSLVLVSIGALLPATASARRPTLAIGVSGLVASILVLLWRATRAFVESLPRVDERHVAVITRHGVYLEIQEPGRIWRWALRPLLCPFDEIKTVIPTMIQTCESERQSILVQDGVEVEVQVQVGYRLRRGHGAAYSAAFAVQNWRNVIEREAIPSITRTVVSSYRLRDLMPDQQSIEERIRAAIADRIAPWGFEVLWAQFRALHVPKAINEALERGMELQSISERLSEVARERLTVITSAISQGVDPNQVMTPNDILILQYIDALVELAKSPATKVVLPYDILEATAGLRQQLARRVPSEGAGAAPAGSGASDSVTPDSDAGTQHCPDVP